MLIQLNRLMVLMILCALMAQSAEAQAAEITSADLVPLEIGNQWTYKQRYWNFAYEGSLWEQNPEIRVLFEVPGGDRDPPDSLLWVERELTIEITHTERIDGWEYFVFSHADYDWPPLPPLFWAGQQVRLSDEGVLLFRWNGQDLPLYALNLQHPGSYSIPAYPLREDLVPKLYVWRWNRDESQIERIFSAAYEINLPNNMDSDIGIRVLPGYGLAFCNESYFEIRELFVFDGEAMISDIRPVFYNVLHPISAIISGEVVSYDQVPRRRSTYVQSRSWGQLKRAFRPR